MRDESHSDVNEESIILECDAVYIGTYTQSYTVSYCRKLKSSKRVCVSTFVTCCNKCWSMWSDRIWTAMLPDAWPEDYTNACWWWVFWDMTPCWLVVTGVSEDLAASIFRVAQEKKAACKKSALRCDLVKKIAQPARSEQSYNAVNSYMWLTVLGPPSR